MILLCKYRIYELYCFILLSDFFGNLVKCYEVKFNLKVFEGNMFEFCLNFIDIDVSRFDFFIVLI